MTDNCSFNVGDKISYYGGKGIIIQINGNTLSVHTDDGRIVELDKNMPLLSKMSDFKSGGRVQFPGGEGEIIKIEERGGSPDLLHIVTDQGDYKQLPENKKGIEPKADVGDEISTGKFGPNTEFDLLTEATRLDLAYRFDRFLSLQGSRIDVTPHQVKAAHKILNSHDQRYLIADEVGLGKTIEAGIVIEELLARGRAERVLIVTPASLQTQWQEEMKDKFDQEYVIYNREFVNSVCQTWAIKDAWKKEDLVITSIDFAKQDDMLEGLKNTHWDIAIIDEAHHLTARRGSDGTINKVDRYNVGEAVSENSDSVLFLTGTPHKGKHDQFYFMLDLLVPYRFENEHDISPKKLNDVMIRRLKSNPNMVNSDGTPMFPEKYIETLGVDFTEKESNLYEDITSYLQNEYRLGEDQEKHAAGFSKVIYQKRLVSSIQAIQRSLEKRADHLRKGGGKNELSQVVEKLLPQYEKRPETLTEKQRERIEKELQSVSSGQSAEEVRTELNTLDDLLTRAHSIDIDSKAKKLKNFINNLLESDPDEKILIFTEYTDTLEYLRDRVLPQHNIAQIHGSMSQGERRRQVETFRNNANIMIATDAAREGINLQFAHIMVNYDLPWNPIRIDQRMGRLHRYGQENDVFIYNLFVKETRESDILENLIMKIDRIEKDLGMRSDVLGMILDDSDFNLEDRIMEAIKNKQSGKQVVDDLDLIIEERKDAVKTIQENFLISDQFGESDLEEIQQIIDNNKKDHLGQEDVRNLVELFISEFGGEISVLDIKKYDGEIVSIKIPPMIYQLNDDVDMSYNKVTFDQNVAKEHEHIDFISMNHPLIENIIEYCLNEKIINGQTTVKYAANSDTPPGIKCNFRLGYTSADGSDETEEFVSIYVTVDAEVSDSIPDTNEGIKIKKMENNQDVVKIMEKSSDIVDIAKNEAKNRVQEMAEVAEQEKAEVVDIKRTHAKRYFEDAIETWEVRLENYKKEKQKGKDMTLPIRNANSKIKELQDSRKAEFEKLHQEESVLPEAPKLVNAAVIVPNSS